MVRGSHDSEPVRKWNLRSMIARFSSIGGLVLPAVSVFGFLGAVTLILILLGNAGVVDLGFVVGRWGTLWGPAGTSLILTTVAFLLGLAIATPLGLVRAYAPAVIRRRPRRKGTTSQATTLEPSPGDHMGNAVKTTRKLVMAPTYGIVTAYVEAIRGTPFYVQMWIVFYLISFTSPRLPNLFFIIGLVTLTLSTVGYQAEIFRAGFQSVSQGQIEAAKAIGMRGRQIFAHISLPQALRLIVLPLTNEWIGIFKVSAILNYISVQELMYQAGNLGSNQAHPIEAFLMVAVMYCAILIPLGRVLTYVEQKKRIPGLGTPIEEPALGRRRLRAST